VGEKGEDVDRRAPSGKVKLMNLGTEFIGHGKSLFDSRSKFPAQMKQRSLFQKGAKNKVSRSNETMILVSKRRQK
jgi:hypothetical protein